MSIVRRWLLRVVLAVAGVAALYLIATPTGRYLLRAGWEEGKILWRREPIPELVRSPATLPALRGKLRLVLEARDFAADSVRLDVGESFTTYSRLDRDTLVLLVSASRRDELKAKTWWFPIVGRVPYKGYFDFGAALRTGEDLEADGYDTFIRPASAFSTLGYFNDPLLPTTVRQDSLDLVNTVIHELTHNTFYARGEAVFNESFANFVGARGAAWFYRARGDERAAALVEARWEDEKLMARFWGRLHHVVDSTFDAHPGDALRARRLVLRDSLYAAARVEIREQIIPKARTMSPVGLGRIRLDNASLLARRTYSTELELFDAVWRAEGQDLRRTIARVMALAEDAEDPFEALRGWLARTVPLPAMPTAESVATRPSSL
jgi:predicted aminopeptidase